MSKCAVIRWKPLALCILIPLAVGAVVGFLTSGSMQDYTNLQQPPLSPPGVVFPIVWMILYILMGISAYLVLESSVTSRMKALRVFGLQLFVNALWPIIFFNLKMRLFAFFWLIFLIILIVWMMVLFYRINKTAAYLQLPYLIWSIFAGYLNLGVFLLNQ